METGGIFLDQGVGVRRCGGMVERGWRSHDEHDEHFWESMARGPGVRCFTYAC